jgi:hypothetical protein
MNRRMPNGTYGGVRGGGREAPAYSIACLSSSDVICINPEILGVHFRVAYTQN